MGGGGGTSTSKTTAEIPKELKPLYSQTAQGIISFQGRLPLTQFASPNPQAVVGPHSLETQAMELAPQTWYEPLATTYGTQFALGAPMLAGPVELTAEQLANAPTMLAARQAFELTGMPTIQNQMALAGLGRSTSMGDMLSRAWVASYLPLAQSEIARYQAARDLQAQLMGQMAGTLAGIGQAETARELQALNAMAQLGQTGRNIVQAAYDALYADFLRRQALAEQALFGPMGMFPSTIGQKTTTTQSGGK